MIGTEFFNGFRDYSAQLSEIAKAYHTTKTALVIDCLFCRLFHGANVIQYVNFSMYKMSFRERQTYITSIKTKKLEKIFNNASREEHRVIGGKARFNQTFAEFVHRDWIFAPEASDEDLLSFLQKHPVIFVKPNGLTKGEGIFTIKSDELDLEQKKELIDRAKAERLLFEEFVQQHPLLQAVNPSSVNTIRVCSVRDKSGEVHIIGASLRGGGANSVVDNLHAGGVQYPIDVTSGLIIRGGVTFDGQKNIFYHPTTNTKMIGMQIPNWQNVLDTIRKAGRIPKNLRYIGWDIAVTEAGCELIEANYEQGVNGMQQDGVGKYGIIMKYV